MKAKGFDRRFDEGEHVTDVIDLGRARRRATERRGSTWTPLHGWSRQTGRPGVWASPAIDHRAVDRRTSSSRTGSAPLEDMANRRVK
jgi:hypothetical protein